MFPKYINLRRGAYIVSLATFEERKDYLISDHCNGSPYVPMGITVWRNCLHQRNGWIRNFHGPNLRPYGLRLHPCQKGPYQIELTSKFFLLILLPDLGADRVVRLRPIFGVLLPDRCKLARTSSLGMWSCTPLSWVLGDSIDRNDPARPSEGLLPLFPSYALFHPDQIIYS